MAVKNPKNKGSSFEREFCKTISLWLSNKNRDDLFWRTSNSGGRYTIRKKSGKETDNQEGDITATDFDYKFVSDNIYFELKNYKDANLWSIITESKGGIYEWWLDTKKKAASEEKIPVLVVKQNNKPILWLSNGDFGDKMAYYFSQYPIMQFLDGKQDFLK
jgi:hypothetical protein